MPLAVTDNLNFGNPERPEIMGQFVGAIKGIGEACRALDFPIVSGNVSLYNETNGEGILPTPTIGGVGLHPRLVEDGAHRLCRRGRGDPAGRRARRLGHAISASRSTARHPRPRATARRRRSISPHEKRVGDLVRALIRDGVATAVHDVSDGGLAVALAEMAMAGGIGADRQPARRHVDPIPVFFGEDQGRYLVTIDRDDRVDWFLDRDAASGHWRLRAVDRRHRRPTN